MAADPDTISDIDLRYACRIVQDAKRLSDIALSEELEGTPVDSLDPRLHRYLRSQIGHAREERFHVVFLDARGRYLRDELVAAGSARQVPLRVRAVVKRAIELGATHLILAHNHPSGACTPSAEDVEATTQLRTVITALDIDLVDHLIVSRTAVFSFREGGLL